MNNDELDEKTLESVVNGVPYEVGFNKFKSAFEKVQEKQRKEQAKNKENEENELFEEDLDKMAYDYYHGEKDTHISK